MFEWEMCVIAVELDICEIDGCFGSVLGSRLFVFATARKIVWSDVAWVCGIINILLTSE